MSDRKYGQRGYQDDDRGEDRGGSRGGPNRPPRERRPGPRGRGLGKPTATVFRCAVCGEKQRNSPSSVSDSRAASIDRDSTCWKCDTDLHTCTHCRHFDSSAVGECRASAPEYVASKAKRNTCQLFEAKASQEFAADAGGDSPSAAKSAFDALFKL